MTIGRLGFGTINGKAGWGIYHFGCKCYNIDLGRLYIVWYDKDCKCGECKEHVCRCEE